MFELRSKGEICICFHNPLWLRMVNRRIALIFAITVVKSVLINNFTIEMFIGMHSIITIALWLYLVQLEDFSFVWRCHHYKWRTENFDLYLAFLAIKKWGFFSVLFLLWHGTSVHNGQYLAPVTLILPIVWLSSCHYLF